MPGKFLKGAFVEFLPGFLTPSRNIIIFQFNPETMTHTWTPAAREPAAPGGGQSNPLAVSGLPGESFSFTLAMDASDMITDGTPQSADLGASSGIYTRLAALEMLLYPTGAFQTGSLVGSVSASISAGGVSIGASISLGIARSVPQSTVPVVLFVWGPRRILPVRITNLTITEKLYDSSTLNPTHAEAQIGLTVLAPDEIKAVTGQLGGIANDAYVYSQDLRKKLASANLANATEAIIGMLPAG